MNPGFRVRKRTRAVSQETVESFRGLPLANVGDSMNRVFGSGPRLKPMHGDGKVLAGPALTVRTRPGDNLLVHHALDIASPGDVIVVDAGGDLTTAIIGGIMARIALRNGIAGLIIDGAIRDVAEIQTMGLPVYAAGVSHRGPYKDGPGEINTAISIGGMVIETGDLILGDSDGFIAVPYGQTEEVLAKAQAKQRAEEKDFADIRDGRDDRTWVVGTLKARGCTFEE